MRDYQVIYEQAISENFERDIYSGRFSKEYLLEEYKQGKFSQTQLDILEEAGVLAGLKSAAGAVGSGLKNAATGAANAVGNAAQSAKSAVGNGLQAVGNAYNTGRNLQVQKNAVAAFQKAFANVVPTLNALKTSFNDQDITTAQVNLAAWAKYIQNKIASKYPQVAGNAQPTNAATPSSPQMGGGSALPA